MNGFSRRRAVIAAVGLGASGTAGGAALTYLYARQDGGADPNAEFRGGNAYRPDDSTAATAHGLNILAPDFGVDLGGFSSQTDSIQTAFDLYPGRSFVFPPGDYRLDSQLNITRQNSLFICAGARLFCGAPMENLINHDNQATHADKYAENTSITGFGELDGNLLAENILRVNAILRMSLGFGLTLSDGVHRGLLVDSKGAELHCVDLRIKNSGTSNINDNIGIECLMSDCQFSMISMRDVTVGVIDHGSLNIWDGIHPWLGDHNQLTARYPHSVAFVCYGNSIMSNAYADTYRYGWRSYPGSTLRLDNPSFYGNPGNLSAKLAEDYPGAIFDFTDEGGRITAIAGRYIGHPDVPHSFAVGDTRRFSADMSDCSHIDGAADYIRGVQQRTVTFAPTIEGSSVPGRATYTHQRGHVEVRDGYISYRFRLKATLDLTVDGTLQIGGLPLPVGATSVESGMGAVCYSTGLPPASLIGIGGSSAPLKASLNHSGPSAGEIDARDFRGKMLEVWGEIVCSFDYPS